MCKIHKHQQYYPEAIKNHWKLSVNRDKKGYSQLLQAVNIDNLYTTNSYIYANKKKKLFKHNTINNLL